MVRSSSAIDSLSDYGDQASLNGAEAMVKCETETTSPLTSSELNNVAPPLVAPPPLSLHHQTVRGQRQHPGSTPGIPGVDPRLMYPGGPLLEPGGRGACPPLLDHDEGEGGEEGGFLGAMNMAAAAAAAASFNIAAYNRL